MSPDPGHTAMTENMIFDESGLPYSPRFDDHYHSRHDGQAECRHVFIGGNDLPAAWTGKPAFSIGELGFGTGLNFLETWSLWRKSRSAQQTMTFTSLDGWLPSQEFAQQALQNWSGLDELTQQLLANWDDLPQGVVLDSQTRLQVFTKSADTAIVEFPHGIDAWYFDGFSPAKNGDMWSLPLMQEVGRRTQEGGSFASYTAAGWVRRNIEAAGFDVRKCKGFGTKRDMICGTKL